jgi:hypothetical protein
VLSAGNSSSVWHVQPTLATDAPLNINPTATNNPFNGTAIVEGGAGAPGYLILQGTGALISATAIDVRAGGVLRFESSGVDWKRTPRRMERHFQLHRHAAEHRFAGWSDPGQVAREFGRHRE